MPNASGVSRSHWTPRAFREGADRSGPEARRPPSDHKAGNPRGKGWLISMHKLIAGLAAGLVVLVAAPAALAANVSVRVEGTAGHAAAADRDVDDRPARSPRTASPSHQCSRNSAAGALEAATGGNWDGALGARSATTSPDASRARRTRPRPATRRGTYWSFWLNYQFSSAGGCGTPMQDGDDVLFFPSCFGRCAKRADAAADHVGSRRRRRRARPSTCASSQYA